MASRSVRRAALAMVAVGLAMSLVACGDDDDTDTAASQSPSTQATTATTTAPVATTALAPIVKTAAKDPFGTIIVDSAGKALYTWDRDTTATSTCTGGCAATWPPLLLPAGASTPLPPQPGVTGAITVSNHPAGGSQIVWNGKPLYRYAADVNPGDVTGDGVGGTWHIAKL